MSDDDMEDYGFEYSDEEVEEEDVDIENQYYNSKGANNTGQLLLITQEVLTDQSCNFQVCLRAALPKKPCKAFKRW